MSLSTPDKATTSPTAGCLHCGTPFRPTPLRQDYCCAGCQFVHDLIKKNGLGQFYDLRGDEAQPVQSLVFQQRDYTWLRDLVQTAEAEDSDTAHLNLELQGLSCIGCVWLVEKLFAAEEGAQQIRVDPTFGTLEMHWAPGVFDVLTFARKVQGFGYLVGPPGQKIHASDRGLTVRLGICGALALNAMLFTLPGYLGMETSFQFAPLFSHISLIIATLSLFVGGSYFFTRSWTSLCRGILHIDLPISAGLLAAYASSVYAFTRNASGFVYFDFVAVFTFLMLGGRWLQQKAAQKNRHYLLSTGPTLRVLRPGTQSALPLNELQPGTQFEVPAGQPVPVRSRLLSSAATLGLEWINGESEAVTAPCGRTVASGAMNCGAQPIALQALEAWPESLLAHLTESTTVASYRDLSLERFIRFYMAIVLGLSAIAFFTWWRVSGDLLIALQVLTSILVVSCPCASGVALPLADDLAAALLRRAGVFIREVSIWARLSHVRQIIFDKTGTLTLETMALRNPETLQRLPPAAKSILLAMTRDNLHPVSCALRETLLAAGIEAQALPNCTETIGAGVELTINGQTWRLGRRGWAGEADGDCIFSRDGEVLAAFCFTENMRADAAEETARLRACNYQVFILSGDRPAKVAAMAAQLHLPPENCHSGMSPRQKAEWIRAIDRRDTLVIGDGANDSLAFDAALCSGTPAIDRNLLERKADFYFLGRGLGGVRYLLETAALRRRTARDVVAFAIAYNVVAIGLAITGQMNPLVAAILMPLSSLATVGIVLSKMRSYHWQRCSK